MNFVSALRTDSKNGKHYILSCKSKKKKKYHHITKYKF